MVVALPSSYNSWWDGQVWQTDTASTTRSHIMMTISLYLFAGIKLSHLITRLLCDRPIEMLR
jgi:hypothetical protein